MRILVLLFLMVIGGCATKYLVPANRFITPETQGGAFKGQFELQKTQAHELTIDTSDGSVNDGVTYEEITRTGYLLSMSIFDQIDLIWAHTGGANSMMGGKFQLIGDSRAAKGSGHRLAIGLLLGGNEHETDDRSVEFTLQGQEAMLIYGYRFNEHVLPYVGLSRSNYTFDGEIKSHPDPDIEGTKPSLGTRVTALNMGGEFSFESVFFKFESSYQRLETSDTKLKTSLLYGLSFGLSW